MTEPLKDIPAGIARLREPFAENHISKLPKPTKAQTEAVKKNFKEGIRCQICGGWHHPKVVHLDYVGHAALTDRLLECDYEWSWEPFAIAANGSPLLDADGGLWIKLTVCGITRIGYGDADGKKGGNAIKEAIGDALRNAAMRFGAALDLWHKGDLHLDEPDNDAAPAEQTKAATPANDLPARLSRADARALYTALQNGLRAQVSAAALSDWSQKNKSEILSLPIDWEAEIKAEYKAEMVAFKANAEQPKEQAHV